MSCGRGEVKGWCIAAQPLFLVPSPGEHGKLDDPGKVHRVRIVELQIDAEPLPQRVERLAGDLELVGHEDEQVARRGRHRARRSSPATPG